MSPEDMTTLRQRFNDKTKRTSNGCLEWTAAKSAAGYGQIRFQGRLYYATHVSWFLSTERWPKRINHKNKCHNRACVDIDHIYEGTARQNMLDRKIDGTHWSPFEQPGFRPHNAVLDSEKRRKIKKMYATGQITQKILGEIFSVSRGTIADVVRGRYGW